MKNCFSKKKKKCISIIWGLKTHLFKLDDYLLSCSGDDSGRVSRSDGGVGGNCGNISDCGGGERVGGGNSGGGNSGSSSSCRWL